MKDKTPRSFVTFADGHEEDILHIYEDCMFGRVFITKSGVYGVAEVRDDQYPRSIHTVFYTMVVAYSLGHFASEFYVTDKIVKVTIDERIRVEYTIALNGDKDGYRFTNSILVPRNYSDEQIEELIRKESLCIYSWNKCEERRP